MLDLRGGARFSRTSAEDGWVTQLDKDHAHDDAAVERLARLAAKELPKPPPPAPHRPPPSAAAQGAIAATLARVQAAAAGNPSPELNLRRKGYHF